VTVEVALVLSIVAAALVLFATQRLRLDVSALLLLVVVIAIPQVFHSDWLVARGVDLAAAFPTVAEGLSGLSNPATITVLAMFILSAGVQRTGLVHVLGRRLFTFVEGSERRQLMVIALVVGPVSGFVNNTAAVAVAIPMVLDMAKRSGTKASRLLLPLSFFGMMGGTLTVVGTSTNILASSLLADVEEFGRSIGMFEFTRVGLVVLIVGFVYFLTVGPLLLPHRDAQRLDEGDDALFIVEASIPASSELVGATLADNDFASGADVEVMRLIRGGRSYVAKAADVEVAAGDVLQVRANFRATMDLIARDDVAVLSEFADVHRVRGDGRLVRVLLRNRRRFAGRPARSVDFWARYHARPIGIERDDVSAVRLADEPLDVGEVVIMEVSATSLARLQRHPDLVVLEEQVDDFDRRRMVVAAGIVAGVVAGAALTPLPIVVTALIGVVAMVLTGCVREEDLYTGVSWDVIFLLAGVIPLGIAMTKSGAADWVASLLVGAAGDWHPLAVLLVLYVVTTVLTELVSNNASVVILVPVAVSLGIGLGIDVFAVVLVVMFAASTSFLSPVGYQTNTMVFGTGVYRFSDFAKVGAPLNVLLAGTTCVTIWLWLIA